jgi:carbonic anhydrase
MIKAMLDELKANNRRWAERKVAADPGFFKRLEGQQAPKYLWIGCADSRVPANEIVDLDPGELFVHRNIANLAPPQDANYLSVLQFSVEVLKVEHILVVGHYGCGGVAAAVDGKRRGLIDHWVHPIREVHHDHRYELEVLLDERARWDRLVELNVMRPVKNVASDVFVRDAWERGQKLSVHGWVYSIADGLIRDLNVTVDNPDSDGRGSPTWPETANLPRRLDSRGFNMVQSEDPKTTGRPLNPTSAAYYQAKAQETEAAAQQIRYEFEREAMLRIAQQYRVLEANARQRESGKST